MTGEHAPIHGRGQLQLGIGSLTVPQELWVADIHDECILGLDFLQTHNCQVNLKDGSLIIGEEEIPLKKSQATVEPTCYKVVLKEGVCIPPLAEAVIPVRLEGAGDDGAGMDYHWGLLEQEMPKFLDNLLVARTLVDLQQKQIPLRVMNLSNQPQMINKGTQLANCETINCVVVPEVDISGERVTGCTQKAEVLDKLPLHLKELYERSVAVLDQTEHREVHQLLCEFADIFSTGPHDLGCTDLVKHRINTGEAPPIRQPLRRLPLVKREEAERVVQEMHEQGVVEPSASPWASPIVLVGKMGVLGFAWIIVSSTLSLTRTPTDSHA